MSKTLLDRLAGLTLAHRKDEKPGAFDREWNELLAIVAEVAKRQTEVEKPYSFTCKLGDHSVSISFGTHDELMAYLREHAPEQLADHDRPRVYDYNRELLPGEPDCKIFVDGVWVHDVMQFCPEMGWVMVRDPAFEKCLKTLTLRGKVEVQWPEKK